MVFSKTRKKHQSGKQEVVALIMIINQVCVVTENIGEGNRQQEDLVMQ